MSLGELAILDDDVIERRGEIDGWIVVRRFPFRDFDEPFLLSSEGWEEAKRAARRDLEAHIKPNRT